MCGFRCGCCRPSKRAAEVSLQVPDGIHHWGHTTELNCAEALPFPRNASQFCVNVHFTGFAPLPQTITTVSGGVIWFSAGSANGTLLKCLASGTSHIGLFYIKNFS